MHVKDFKDTKSKVFSFHRSTWLTNILLSKIGSQKGVFPSVSFCPSKQVMKSHQWLGRKPKNEFLGKMRDKERF